MKKYPDIEYIGHPDNETMLTSPDDEIVVEEKVDGGNGQFFVEAGVLHFCSRNRDLTTEKDERAFKAQRDWLISRLEGKIAKMDSDYIYFVEWMQKHTIHYGTIPLVIGLDIIPKEGRFGKVPMFMGRRAKEIEFEKLGIPCVQLKGIFKASEITQERLDDFMKESAYYTGLPEGIVIKNYGRMNVWGRQMFGKLVRQDFKEHNKAVFGGLKHDNSDSIKLVEQFATDARIRKKIHSLIIEGGHKLERSLMKWLPSAVIKDIFKEETDSILKNFSTIHIATIKTLIAKKCLYQIDKMIAEIEPVNLEPTKGAVDGKPA